MTGPREAANDFAMTGFSPAERIDVDNQVRLLVAGFHELGPQWAARLRTIFQQAEQAPTDPTLARVLVAAEMLRGIAADSRSPLTIRGFALPASISTALREAEALGRDLGPHVHAQKRGLIKLFAKPAARLSREAREALMRCRMIGVQYERRVATPGTAVRAR